MSVRVRSRQLKICKMEYDKHTEDLLRKLTEKSNRSVAQTKELYELCRRDFKKLVALEEKIMRHLVHYSPGDLEEVNKLINAKDSCWYSTERGMEWSKKCSLKFDEFVFKRSKLNRRLRKKKKLGEFK
jgi:hypothetical protein